MAGQQIEVSIKRYLETLRTKNIKVKKAILYGLPQQFLYFLPLPQGQGSFLPVFLARLGWVVGKGSRLDFIAAESPRGVWP